MFDQITVVYHAFTGGLKGEATLRRYFWFFLVAIFMALGIVAYNAYMSLNYYGQLLERFTPWSNWLLPIIMTSLIALTVYWGLSSITGTILDQIHGRFERIKKHRPMFIAATIAVSLLMGFDILANLRGVDYVSHSTTTSIMENPLDDITQLHDQRVQELESRYQKSSKAVQKKIERLKAPLGDRSHQCNQTGCEKGVYRGEKGNPHWQGALTPFGHHLLSAYEAQLTQLASTKTQELESLKTDKETQLQAAKDDYQRDKTRYDNTIHHKQSGHSLLVALAYLIAALLTCYINHYTTHALEHITEKQPNQAPSSISPQNQIGFSPGGMPVPSSAEQNRIRRLEAQLAALQHSMNAGVNPGDNPQDALSAVLQEAEPTQLPTGINPEDIAFLRKYPQAVRDTLDGLSKPDTARNSGISVSTVKNVRRVMRALRMV